MSKQANATPLYVVNAKRPYAPRANTAQGNTASWQLVQAALAGGPLTAAQLMDAVKPVNHTPFIGYAIRRGWLVATK